MTTPHFDTLAIVGVGLLGGSIGLAAKQRGLVRKVVGIGRSPETLQRAHELGAIDTICLDLEQGVADADLVVLCTPVRHIVTILPTVLAGVKDNAIVTDVGSTKVSIVEAAEHCLGSARGFFVGSHPMAGSEKSGVGHARADLFVGTTCFLTPTERTSHSALAAVARWWQSLDCRLALARPHRHDHLVALISHLPHLVAVALVRTVESFKEDQNLVKGIIGNGFRDTTRIACGSAQMWQDICAENTEEIRRAAAAFQEALQRLVEEHTGDIAQLEKEFLAACDFRKTLDER